MEKPARPPHGLGTVPGPGMQAGLASTHMRLPAPLCSQPLSGPSRRGRGPGARSQHLCLILCRLLVRGVFLTSGKGCLAPSERWKQCRTGNVGEKQENKHPRLPISPRAGGHSSTESKTAGKRRAGGPRSGSARAWDPASLRQSIDPEPPREKRCASELQAELSPLSRELPYTPLCTGWLNPTEAFSHSSGGWKSKLTVLAGPVPSGGSGEGPCPPSFLQLGRPCQSLAGSCTEPVSVSLSTQSSSLCAPLCVLASSHRDTGHRTEGHPDPVRSLVS